MMRSMIPILALIVTTAPVEARRPPTTSWGKSGVSFEDYRRDARECALKGGTADIRKWEPTKGVLQGIKGQEVVVDTARAFNPNDVIVEYALIYRRRIRGNVQEVQQTMVGMVEQCLIDRGYAQFTLDHGQERQLRRLKWGTEERARYLYALAAR